MRKLLLVLLISFVGAGIAFGASSVFFSSSPDEESDVVEPQGLVDELATDEPDEPSPTPSATPSSPPARPSTGASGSTAAAVPAEQDDPAPRQPSGSNVINSQNGVVVTEGDGFSDECRDENSEQEREQCEDDLEAEAEAEADEAEEEAEQDAEEDEDDD